MRQSDSTILWFTLVQVDYFIVVALKLIVQAVFHPAACTKVWQILDDPIILPLPIDT